MSSSSSDTSSSTSGQAADCVWQSGDFTEPPRPSPPYNGIEISLAPAYDPKTEKLLSLAGEVTDFTNVKTGASVNVAFPTILGGLRVPIPPSGQSSSSSASSGSSGSSGSSESSESSESSSSEASGSSASSGPASSSGTSASSSSLSGSSESSESPFTVDGYMELRFLSGAPNQVAVLINLDYGLENERHHAEGSILLISLTLSASPCQSSS